MDDSPGRVTDNYSDGFCPGCWHLSRLLANCRCLLHGNAGGSGHLHDAKEIYRAHQLRYEGRNNLLLDSLQHCCPLKCL